MIALLAAAVLAASPPPSARDYRTYCASCHGADLRGSVNGPSLRGAGAAKVDFWLRTGRMPAAIPWIEVGHRGQALPDATIANIIAYVVSTAPGGLPIPRIHTGGDLARGRALYDQNCQHCHGIAGDGGSIGGNEYAPSLHLTPIVQVAEAVRTGPGQMPPFSAAQLTERDLVDVVSYVVSLDAASATPGLPLRTGGTVPEGLIGWLAAAALALFAFAFSKGR